jgi:isocitrate dehydrogenase
MWNAAGKLQETKAVIPDSSYAGIYTEVFEDCKKHGAYDPKHDGQRANVGLMAQQAEEYGSHNKTFEIAALATVRVVDARGNTADAAHGRGGATSGACARPRTRRSATGSSSPSTAPAPPATPAVFWLDAARTTRSSSPRSNVPRTTTQRPRHPHPLALRGDALLAVERIRQGLDTISVTGNVLRDYLTDLFPILEVGTSAKMLSIVPLMNGGGLFETGAGGSAPKHVQQFLEENCLRWDSLGEFLALAVSFEHLAERFGNARAAVLADTLDAATGLYLVNDKRPRPARSARSTTAAATSTSRSTGPRRSPRRPTTPRSRPTSPPSPPR